MYPPVSVTVSTDNRRHLQTKTPQGGIIYKGTNCRDAGGMKDSPRECASNGVAVTTSGPKGMFLEPGRRRSHVEQATFSQGT